jgi:hypothetical protein
MQQQQSPSSTPLVKRGVRIMIKSPVPREEKQLAIVLKEEDIRRKMWDTGNSAAAAATRGRLAKLANTPHPSLNGVQAEVDMRIPMFLIFLIFVFCFLSSIYKYIHTLLLKHNKDLEIQRFSSHDNYTIGVKEEVGYNLQLHHPLIRSRAKLSRGELSV